MAGVLIFKYIFSHATIVKPSENLLKCSKKSEFVELRPGWSSSAEHVEGQLTQNQIVRLASSISMNNVAAIAEGYMDISDEVVKNKRSENKDDAEAFNREIIKIWRNKNPDNQIKVSEFFLVTCNI